jgi:two-component system chemotaxis sensor kinase CheA
VDHGLECTQKRIEQGKSEIGNINCSIYADSGSLKISIEDDGGGICFDQIRSKAVDQGLYSVEEAKQMQDKQLIELIFKDNFSTKDMITELSGRGMGLYAVKSEVEKLGGEVELFTVLSKGTRLEFTLPIMEIELEEALTAAEFVQPVLTTTLDFLKEHLGTNLNITRITPFHSVDFQLLHYTSFINIRGMFDGQFGISMDSQIAHILLNCMVYETIQEQQVHRYTKDVIAECANMILGNSIKAYPNIEEQIIIGTPSILYNSKGDINYEGNEMKGYRVETDKGAVVITIIQ